MSNYDYGFRRTTPSVYQQKLRDSISPDKYATFKWRTQAKNSYQLFGAFIINGGEDLKWVNTAEFEDEYSSSLYKSTRSLLGVTQTSKKLSFSIGVYAITLNQYKEFVNWLDPFVISQLILDYNPEWNYTVKISEITESTKYVIDYNQVNSTEQASNPNIKNEEPLYYVETSITFETQNEGYCLGNEPWLCTQTDLPSKSIDSKGAEKTVLANTFYKLVGLPSDLNHPCKISVSVKTNSVSDEAHILTCKAYLLNEDNKVLEDSGTTLFSLQFANENEDVSFTYDSERGLLFYDDQLLTLQTVNHKGTSIVSGYNCVQFRIPGLMTSAAMDKTITGTAYNYRPVAIQLVGKQLTITTNSVSIITYPRNVLS